MKIHYPRDLVFPPDADLWVYFLNTGDIQDAGFGLVGSTPPGMTRKLVVSELLKYFHAEGYLSDEALQEILDDNRDDGYYLELVGPHRVGIPSTAPAARGVEDPAADPAMETVNAHRARLGMDPIDPSAGWTPDEIREMAERIRLTGRMNNPSLGALKRKLMG